jgi:flagellar hook-associated protein 2
VGSSGLGSVSSGSGIDVQAFVDQIIYADRAPVRLLQTQQTQFNAQATALRDLATKLSTLETAMDALRDTSGEFNAKTVSASDEAILTATASASALAATHTISVTALATTSSYYTGQLAEGSTEFGAGAFQIQVGSGAPVTITVDDTRNTLDELVSHINSLGTSVAASVITDTTGARLSLVSKSSGAAGDLAISGNTTGLSFTKAVTGANATLTVNGVPVETTSNTVTGVIAGVTLSLSALSLGTPVTITVKPDTSQANQAVKDFVTGYNALLGAINTQFTYNAATKKAGPLASDSSVRLLQQQLLSAIQYSISGNGGIVNLATMGVDVSNDGTLTIDNAELDDALADHFAEVQNFLQSLTPAGFARKFSTTLDALGDSVDGPLNIALGGVNRTLDTISDQIRNFESRLELRRQALTEQFSRIDALLQRLPTLMSQISNQLSSLR